MGLDIDLRCVAQPWIIPITDIYSNRERGQRTKKNEQKKLYWYSGLRLNTRDPISKTVVIGKNLKAARRDNLESGSKRKVIDEWIAEIWSEIE